MMDCMIFMLNPIRMQNAECVKQVVKYVLDRCPDVRLKTQFREILLTNRIGLIVNERVVNLPVEVSPILHDNLHEEIQTGIKVGVMHNSNGQQFSYICAERQL